MAFCCNCGKEVNENAVICPQCGCYAKPPVNKSQEVVYDSSSVGWGILGFILPLIGFILWLVWNDNRPLRAKSVGTGALVGVVTPLALIIIGLLSTVSLGGLFQ